MKLKSQSCSTGHGTGAIQPVPLHRSALMRNKRRIRTTSTSMRQRAVHYAQEKAAEAQRERQERMRLAGRVAELQRERQEREFQESRGGVFQRIRQLGRKLFTHRRVG